MNSRIIAKGFVALLFWYGSSLICHAAPYDVYAVKTAFLYRSLHYVEWNSDQVAIDTEINICFVQPNKFTETFSSLNQRKVNERRINIKKIASYRDTGTCQVIYIAPDISHSLAEIITELKNHRLLTFSDQAGFAASGVIINFPVDDQKVFVEINIDAANELNFRFSAKLLRIARIIGKE